MRSDIDLAGLSHGPMQESVNQASGLRKWDQVPDGERVRLLGEFGRYQDQLSPTCSLDLKVERLQSWLQLRGIAYRHDG